MILPGDPLAHLALDSLLRAEASVRRRLTADLEREGLSASGFSVLVVLAAAGGELEPPEGGTVWSALIVTSLIASALGFFVQTFAQQHAPPARTALILASEPAFAGLFGWLLADERLDAIQWAGAALIMAAILAVELYPRLRPPRPLPEG